MNWRPALVLRMGIQDMNSGTGYFSNDETAEEEMVFGYDSQPLFSINVAPNLISV